MKTFTTVAALSLLVTAVPALDAGRFEEDAKMDVGFKGFMLEFFKNIEDANATSTFTDHFVKDTGVFSINGKESKGNDAILAAKQNFTNADKTTNHILRFARSLGQQDKTETFIVDLGLRTTTTKDKGCTETVGRAQFTLTTGQTSRIELSPHTNFLAKYQLDVLDVVVPCPAVQEEVVNDNPDTVEASNGRGRRARRVKREEHREEEAGGGTNGAPFDDRPENLFG